MTAGEPGAWGGPGLNLRLPQPLGSCGLLWTPWKEGPLRSGLWGLSPLQSQQGPFWELRLRAEDTMWLAPGDQGGGQINCDGGQVREEAMKHRAWPYLLQFDFCPWGSEKSSSGSREPWAQSRRAGCQGRLGGPLGPLSLTSPPPDEGTGGTGHCSHEPHGSSP